MSVGELSVLLAFHGAAFADGVILAYASRYGLGDQELVADVTAEFWRLGRSRGVKSVVARFAQRDEVIVVVFPCQ